MKPYDYKSCCPMCASLDNSHDLYENAIFHRKFSMTKMSRATRRRLWLSTFYTTNREPKSFDMIMIYYRYILHFPLNRCKYILLFISESAIDSLYSSDFPTISIPYLTLRWLIWCLNINVPLCHAMPLNNLCTFNNYPIRLLVRHTARLYIELKNIIC